MGTADNGVKGATPITRRRAAPGAEAAQDSPEAVHEARAHDVGAAAALLGEQHILTAKISVPLLRPGMIARRRLIDDLAAKIDAHLTLIAAPAGFGKTTALAQWSTRSPWPVAWMSLDASDNDPVRFLRSMIAALARAGCAIGADALDLLRVAQVPALDAALTCLLNALAASGQEVVLVLDDYHVVTAPEVHACMTFLLDYLPSTLHLVICSRTRLPLAVARLRLRGRVAEVSEADLRFLPQEVADFCAQEIGPNLSSDDIRGLAECTEGWIAALRLAALSLQGHQEISHLVEAFAVGSHHSLVDYLSEEVLQHQPADVRVFLLNTCILNRLSGPLCEFIVAAPAARAAAGGGATDGVPDGADGGVTGAAERPMPGGSGQAMLERLERAHLFLLPLDAERHWYRYHHLFAEFLRERVRVSQPGVWRALHRRAARWYEQQHLHHEAIEHALVAADYRCAARVMRQIGTTLVRSSEITTVGLWLEALPGRIVRADPHLCMLHAWTDITLGRFDSGATWLDAAEDALSDAGPATDSLESTGSVHAGRAGVRGESTQRALLGELAALRAHIAAFQGNVRAAMTFAHRALELLPADRPYLRGLSALNLGVACWLESDVVAAAAALKQARTLGQTAQNPYVSLMASCGLAHIQIVQGQRRAALATGRQGVMLAAEGAARLLPAAAYVDATMAQLLYERDELDAASTHARQAVDVAERWGDGEALVYAYTAAAQIQQAQGDSVNAAQLMERAAAVACGREQRSWIDVLMMGQQARLALLQGQVETAERWICPTEQAYVGTFAQLTRARIQLARGQPAPALTLLRRELRQALSSRRMGTVIEIYLLQALAHDQKHETMLAQAALKHALALAEPEGYVRIFVDEGAPMAHLLARFCDRLHRTQDTPESAVRVGSAGLRVSPAYVERLLTAFPRSAVTAISAPFPEQPPEKPRAATAAVAATPRATLSEREREIVRCVAAGKSNGDIAGELVLELSTVKWHLSNIFGKLGVRSRTQLTLRAQELHLV
jgi:LuxR family maltose regulon positive regulatory protein